MGGERREEEGWRRVKDDSRIQSLESNEQVHHIQTVHKIEQRCEVE